jgi:hypothetical protein
MASTLTATRRRCAAFNVGRRLIFDLRAGKAACEPGQRDAEVVDVRLSAPADHEMSP